MDAKLSKSASSSHVSQRTGSAAEEEAEELKWAALEKLPTVSRARTSIARHVLDDGTVSATEIDVTRLGAEERKKILDGVLNFVDEDHEQLLRRLRDRMDRVGIDTPTIEVRFENLLVEGAAYVGERGLPTLPNAFRNAIEATLRLSSLNKKVNTILCGLSGIVRPSRMTLLLGPPGSGKTTFLLALAGKLDKHLKTSGRITYCGHELSEFAPQRTCAYVSQHDLHSAELTVREILDFSGKCLGVGSKYTMLLELLRREKDAGIKPDPELDTFMKATSLDGQTTSLATEYIIKILGLDNCPDVVVGNEMRRGISGGQKKRVTIGEMLVGPAKAYFMDEISTGLDSSTTFQIVKIMRDMVHVLDETMIISLLQPAPETFNLFDDIILLSDGQIVYQGPIERILGFFEFVGFRCPERKGVADFLLEVTSKKDQEQYWIDKNQSYRYISVAEFAQFFKSFNVGEQLIEDLKTPYDKSKAHSAAFLKKEYGVSKWKLFKACFSREWLLMKRNSFLYIFKAIQLTIISTMTVSIFLRTQMHHETISDGGKYLSALFYSVVNMMFNGMAELALTLQRLPVFFKQRDCLFYPPWAFGLPIWLLKIPLSLMESGIWIAVTYYSIGFAPSASRFFRHFLVLFCIHQLGLSLFRLIAAVGRNPTVAASFASFSLVAIFVLGGFVISRDDIQPWWIWCYWISPMMYGQNAISINEYLDPRWSNPNNDHDINASTIGEALLESRGMYVNGCWYWISVGALLGFSLLFNLCFILALTYLNPFENARTITVDENVEKKLKVSTSSYELDEHRKITEMTAESTHLAASTQIARISTENSCRNISVADHAPGRAMTLPFHPLSLSFNHVNYYVDMPPEMKSNEIQESRLQLLSDVCGAFRPGILTALIGISGAGKTTLMDVLAGRKTGGYIEGNIDISGYPKNQTTFARVCGYCEQNDIHSPCVTVYESLIFSAWLRLASDVKVEVRKMFVEEVMELVELNLLRDALVGLPGVDGLSTEQRKRLTIAVELVANPSIIFMDEPTTGLDARAAAIVMRAVRNTVDTGRTVVCTIHQPSIDIFESFDELLLLKQGGRVTYAGALGHHSCKLIEYFEAIPGIPKIKDGRNPAAWALEISSPSVEARIGLDLAEVYSSSSLYQENQEIIKVLSTAVPGSKDICFPTKYSQSFTSQCLACFWKQQSSYWRNPRYNAIRLSMTFMFGILFGTIFWNKGAKIAKQQDLDNVLGAMYVAVLFVCTSNSNQVQNVVATERTVLYRERGAGMYSALAYAFAQVCVEVLYIAVQSLIYASMIFSMMGFSWEAGNFMWFTYFIFMSYLYFTMCGMMVISLTPNSQIGFIFMIFLYTSWNLFSGFLVPRPLMPSWCRWYYWLNPVAWTLYGIVESQLGKKANLMEIPGQQSMPVNVYLTEMLGFEYNFLGYVALAQIGFVLFFFFVFIFGINYLNFQRR